MPTDHRDYSGAPLWKKLGVGPGTRIRVVDPPAGFDDALVAIAPLPDGVSFLARSTYDIDVVIAFFTKASALQRRFPSLARSISTDGRLWIAWPKKAAPVDTDLDFASVQGTGLDAELVDNKSASITHEFQGVQFVRRTRDRAKHRTLAR